MSIQYCEKCDTNIDTDFDTHELCGKTRDHNNIFNPNYKHGMSHTRIYRIWCAMKKRCGNKKDSGYKNYGGRGITMCDRWEDFINFYQDMKEGYTYEMSIERIDNNKGYSPQNCKWIHRSEQPKNTRHNKRITINNVTRILTDWCKIKGIHRDTFYYRVNKKGMTDKEALLTKLDIKKSLASRGVSFYNDAEHFDEEYNGCRDTYEINNVKLSLMEGIINMERDIKEETNVEEIPQMKGTLEDLDKITIK